MAKVYWIAADGFKVLTATKNKSVAANAFWSGTSKDKALTMAIERRLARAKFGKEYRKAMARWHRRRIHLNGFGVTAMPAMEAWVKKQRDKVLAELEAEKPKTFMEEYLKKMAKR